MNAPPPMLLTPLGLIPGARHGRSRIPERWLRGLEVGPRLAAFVQNPRLVSQ
ncbi:MAG: hypothetical protein QOE70_1303 [Chthoniobacter sp.]|jgi:hypothetical protein|nr:hypothetical protein [Chthoniobacter sp.]